MIKNKKGVTLIELVIGLGLIAIIVGSLLQTFLNMNSLYQKSMDHVELQEEALCMMIFISEQMEEATEIITTDNLVQINTLKDNYKYRINEPKLYVTQGKNRAEPNILYSSHIKEFSLKKTDDFWQWKVVLKKGAMEYELQKRFYLN